MRFGLPHRLNVTLTVFALLGQEVKTVVIGEHSAWLHEVRFNVTGLACGVYICRLSAGEFIGDPKLRSGEMRFSCV